MGRWFACRRIQDYGCGRTISLVNIVPIFHLVANDIFLVFDVSEAERVFHNAACFRKVKTIFVNYFGFLVSQLWHQGVWWMDYIMLTNESPKI